jgi:hypothetical protein
MTATTTFESPTHAGASRTKTAASLWKTGAIAGVTASVATAATAAIADAAGVPLRVGGQSIPLMGFAQVTLVASIIGTVLAVVLARRAARPQHTFVVTTVALTLASLVPDVLADATTATRFTLALTHVVAAVIVIPALASRLTD